MEWFWQVLVLVRLCWISKPAGMTCSLDAILKSGGGGILGGSLLEKKFEKK